MKRKENGFVQTEQMHSVQNTILFCLKCFHTFEEQCQRRNKTVLHFVDKRRPGLARPSVYTRYQQWAASCWREGVTLEVHRRPLATMPVHLFTLELKLVSQQKRKKNHPPHLWYIRKRTSSECCPAKGGDAWLSY